MYNDGSKARSGFRCPVGNVKTKGQYSWSQAAATSWTYSVPAAESGEQYMTCGNAIASRGPVVPSKRLEELKKGQALVMEGKNYIWWAFNLSSLNTSKDPSSGYSLPMRHNEGTNVCFGDGHMKWMSSRQVWDQATYDKLRGK